MYKKTTLFLLTLIILNGCGTIITVPIDQSLISGDEATVIIYHDEGYTDKFKVFLDRNPIGVVISEKPLKFSIPGGEHEIHTEVTGAIDRVTKQFYEVGKVYYLKIWLDFGMWVHSIRISPAPPIKRYDVRSHRPEKVKQITINKVDKNTDN